MNSDMHYEKQPCTCRGLCGYLRVINNVVLEELLQTLQTTTRVFTDDFFLCWEGGWSLTVVYRWRGKGGQKGYVSLSTRSTCTQSL